MFTAKDREILRKMKIAVPEPIAAPEKIECMTAGESGEPSYSTPAGYTICSRCQRSTRSRDAIVCRPCEKWFTALHAALHWYDAKLRLMELSQQMIDGMNKLSPAQQKEFDRQVYQKIKGHPYPRP